VCTTQYTTLTEITHSEHTERKNSSIKHQYRKSKLFIFTVSTISVTSYKVIFFSKKRVTFFHMIYSI